GPGVEGLCPREHVPSCAHAVGAGVRRQKIHRKPTGDLSLLTSAPARFRHLRVSSGLAEPDCLELKLNPMSPAKTNLRVRGSTFGVGSLACALILLASLTVHAAPKAGGKVDFTRDIRPILSDNCFACHGPDTNKLKADLRLDLKAEAFRKLDSGEFAIVPGKPEESRLLKLVSLPLDDDDHMPPKNTGKKLTAAQIDLLRRWIAEGAKWAEHWSYVAPQRPVAPEAKHRNWARNDIDRFILARLEQARLKPNPEADRYT